MTFRITAIGQGAPAMMPVRNEERSKLSNSGWSISPSHGVSWTWRQFRQRARDLAAGLIKLGLKRGERIGVWSLNRPEWTLTQFAAAEAGLVFVTINPAYRLHELEYALQKVGCAALVTATRFKTSDFIGMVDKLVPELARAAPGALRSARLPDLRLVIQIGESAPGTLPFESISGLGGEVEQAALDGMREQIQFDAAANIQFTSGTTGAPKGVTLSHHNILNNGYFTGRAMRLTSEDRICIPVPLYHCFGMVMGNLAAVTLGAAMVYPGEGFDPLATLKTVEAEKCTALYGVPTMFIAELEHPEFEGFGLSSLRTGIMAGAPCPISVMRKVIERMHMRDVTIAYGMTETSPVSFQSSTEDSIERRVTTIGRVHPHVEVKIIDSAGRIVPRETPGELCTRGYSVMSGYWDEPQRTREAKDSAGWMHTGDLATIDSEGYANIVGRIKDMVIRGGENVYPREIEEFLYGHPAVKDVSVIGVPDERYGEEICAWVILHDGAQVDEEAIKAYCRGTIAHYKVPRYVRFVTEFPLTISGKVQKFKMREVSTAELGLHAAASIVTA